MRKLFDHGKVDLPSPAIAGDGQRPEGRPVIALPATDDLESLRVPDFNLILPRQLERSFDGLRASAGEEYGPAFKAGPCECEQFFRVGLGNRSGELAGVRELELRCLLRHGSGDFRHTVPDEVHRGRSRKVDIALAAGVEQIDALAAHGRGIRFAKRPPQNGRGTGSRGHDENYRGR